MLNHYKVNILTKGIDLERKTLRDRVETPISHHGGLEIEELTLGGGRGFPWRRTMGSYLARPLAVQSPEKEVLEWRMPVRVRERESKEKDNVQGFKYPRTRAQLDIV
jgi:hypothetical protein